MYSAIDAANLAVEAAKGPEGEVMRDRKCFVPFFEAAERYAHDHHMVVGGNAATRLLLGDPLGPSDFFYELYSDNALRDARALTEVMYELDPENLGHYAYMMTREPLKAFEILVDERPLFLVKALAVHRGARAADIIVPSMRPANFAKESPDGEPLQLRCMGPEIQLMSIYAALADPSEAGEWSALLRAEEKLRALYNDEIRGKIAEATSGKTTTGGAPPRMAKLIEALTQSYLHRSGHAVIGSHAVAALSDKPAKGPPRLQLVTANSFQDEERAVQRIATRLGFNVQSTKNEPKVPTDTRLRRMTMYVQRPGERREPFLDIYNAGEYQLVAVAGATAASDSAAAGASGAGANGATAPGNLPDKTASTGSVFTIMRFLLVDAWTIQLLFRMDVTSAQYTRQVLRDLVYNFELTAGTFQKYLRAENFDAIFPPTYIGRFQDPVILAKRERHQATVSSQELPRARRKRTFFPPFYPAREAARKSADEESEA